eukprot:775983-Prymnesium_polylepis.1
MPSRGPVTDWPDFGAIPGAPRRSGGHSNMVAFNMGRATYAQQINLGSCVATDGCADGAATSVAT